MRVTARRDQSRTGGALDLFFARVIGTSRVDVRASATAAVVMGTIRPRGNQGDIRGGMLPFAYQMDAWNALLNATGAGVVTTAGGLSLTVTDSYTVDPQGTGPSAVISGPDGRMEAKLFPLDATSGNFGTVNFSKTKVGNSTSTLRDIIESGPALADWPDLAEIVTASPTNPIDLNGDPGVSAGVESAVAAIIG